MAKKSETRKKNLIKYQKYNFILGFVMLIYPLIRYMFDPMFTIPGKMKFFGLIKTAKSVNVCLTRRDAQICQFWRHLTI